MGMCKDCRYYDVRDRIDGGLFEQSKAYCTYGRQYVKEYSSCSAFEGVPQVTESSGCFLTTACVKYLGKSDDCYELNTMRKFRDEYLIKSASGQILVKEYYEIAPKIVEAIEKSGHSDEYYQKIYDYILKCEEFYNQNKYDDVISTYYDMVKSLKNELM